MEQRTSRSFLEIASLGSCIVLLMISFTNHKARVTGSCQVLTARMDGEQVQVTMKVDLLNYTGDDLRNGTIVLYDSSLIASQIASFDRIQAFPPQSRLSLVQMFLVSQEQYAIWKQGRIPVLRLVVPGFRGRQRLEPIDVVPVSSPTNVVAKS